MTFRLSKITQYNRVCDVLNGVRSQINIRALKTVTIKDMGREVVCSIFLFWLVRFFCWNLCVSGKRKLARCLYSLLNICKKYHPPSPKLISLQWQLNYPWDISKLTLWGDTEETVAFNFSKRKRKWKDLIAWGINIKECKMVCVWFLEPLFRSEFLEFKCQIQIWKLFCKNISSLSL